MQSLTLSNESDHKAGPAHAEQFAETPPICLSALTEELVNRIALHSSLVGQPGLPVEINHQSKRCVTWQLLGPTHNELLPSALSSRCMSAN